MKKLLAIFGMIVFSQMLASAASCPLTSYESRLEYRYSDSMWLICDYRSGRLQTRFFHNDFESTSIDYFPNGMPREYNLRSQNMGGGLYVVNKKYNQSGMMISNSQMSGSSGYECTYAGNYQLRCISYDSGVDFYSSTEYASQYDGNY